MTISTPHAESTRKQAGFTLAEVIVATAISAIVMAGALSAFYLLTRTGYRAAAYSEMSTDLRDGLARFTRDARSATDVRWQDARRVVLLVPGQAGGLNEIAYGYETRATDPTLGRFYRETTPAGGTATRTTLSDGIAPDFHFARYRLATGAETATQAENDLETRLIEVSLRAVRTNPAGVVVSQTARSTRALLRNKHDGQ